MCVKVLFGGACRVVNMKLIQQDASRSFAGRQSRENEVEVNQLRQGASWACRTFHFSAQAN
jgi:hypothetical protein